MNQSYILGKINDTLVFSQNLFWRVTRSSLFIQNIDNIILFFITVLLFAIMVAPTKIIGALAVVISGLFAAKLFLKKDEKFTVSPLDAAVFLYMAIAGISVAFSYLPVEALRGYAKMLIYFGAYLAFYNVLKDSPKRTVYLLGMIALFASLEAFYGILQQVNGVEALARWQDDNFVNPEQLMNRVYGSLQPFNPNLLAGYLIASFSSAAGVFFLFLTKKNIRLSVLSGVGALAILIAIVFTGSRGAYISLSGMLFMLVAISGHIIWHDYKDKKWLKMLWLSVIVSGILAVIFTVISSPSLQHRIASIFAARADSSNSFRMNVWISSFKMFLDNWLIGIGPGNTVFRLTYGMYMITGFDALGAYSVPLEIVVESGIFALLAFGWLIFMVVMNSYKIVTSDSSSPSYNDEKCHSEERSDVRILEQKIIIAACLIGITGIMLHGVVDTIFYRPQVNLIFWMLIAIFAANIRK